MSDDDGNVIRVDFGARSAPAPEPPAQQSHPDDMAKLEVFSELVDVGTVLLTLDTRYAGVVVPERFAGDLRLNLNFCHRFGIPDFGYDEAGVRASLSFSGVDHWCEIPWGAVYMMRSHVENEVRLFTGSIPPEMLAFFGALQPPLEEE